MSFYTAINCIDGRVQLPVINYLMKRFNVLYIDSVTEPGPVRILDEQADTALINQIVKRVEISVNKHKSIGIAIAAHYDCAGNPVLKNEQLKQLDSSVSYIKKLFPNMPVLGLWVDENWKVAEVYSA